MRSQVQKWGNSLALRIPKSVAFEAGLEKESAVEISLEGGKVVISPVAKPNFTLEKLLAGVTRENVHHEIETGPSRGNETW